MSTTIPTTQEIVTQNISNFEAKIGQTIPLQDKAFVRVLATIEALLATSHRRFAIDRLRQNLALTATGDDLDRIGINYGVYRKSAIAWVGTITQPAANGTSIPITVDYTSDASGIKYIVNTASPAAAGGSTTVSVTAAEAGVNGNLSASDTLTIGRQVAGITSSTATFASTVTTGVDREKDDPYRLRILNEIRTVGGGGNAADYRTWAEAITGVYRAYPFAGAPVSATTKLRDGDMELAGVADWLVGNDALIEKKTGTPHGGTQVLRITEDGTNAPYAYQSCLQIGRDYTIAGWARSNMHASALPTVRDGASVVLWTGTDSGNWESFSVSFTATTNDLHFVNPTGLLSQYVEFDDVTLTVDDSLPGDRVVYIEATTAVDADGIPPQTMLDSVRVDINVDPDTGEDRAPLGLTDEKLFIEPITRTSFDVTITDLVCDADSLVACKASLDTGVDEYFRTVAPFVEGVDAEIDRNDVVTLVSLSDAVQDVLDAYGASAGDVAFEVTGSGSPETRYTVDEYETCKLGSISYA